MLAPGFILTDQNRYLLVDAATGAPTARAQAILRTPMGRFGTPADLAGRYVVVVFRRRRVCDRHRCAGRWRVLHLRGGLTMQHDAANVCCTAFRDGTSTSSALTPMGASSTRWGSSTRSASSPPPSSTGDSSLSKVGARSRRVRQPLLEVARPQSFSGAHAVTFDLLRSGKRFAGAPRPQVARRGKPFEIRASHANPNSATQPSGDRGRANGRPPYSTAALAWSHAVNASVEPIVQGVAAVSERRAVSGQVVGPRRHYRRSATPGEALDASGASTI